MKLCEYCKVGTYTENCICMKYDDVCPLVRRCMERRIWVPLDSMGKCARKAIIIKRKEDVELKTGEYLVENIQNGKLYININGSLLKKPNPFDYEPSKVKMVEIDGEWVIETKENKKVEKVEEDVAPKEDVATEQPKNNTYSKKSKKKK